MKRSFLALTILALLLTPALIFPFYKLENVKGINPMCGAYYGGYSWLFFCNDDLENPTDIYQLTYYRMELASNHQPTGAKRVVTQHIQPPLYTWPAGCAVFDEALFVFSYSPDWKCFVYRYLSGTEKSDWNGEWLKIKDTKGNLFPFFSDCGLAPVTFDGKLWLFGSTPEGGLCFVNSSDGFNWSDQMYFPQDSGKHGYDAYLVWEDCNVAACTIVDKDGKEMAIIVWTSPLGYVYSVLCDGENFFNYQRLPGIEQYPRGLGLAQGTRSSCGSGYYVQLFYVQRDKPYKLRRKEYNVDHNTWSTGSEYFDEWYKYKRGPPAGLTAFAQVGNNLEKEVWCIHIEESKDNIYIWRFQSDHLVRLNPETQYCGDTTYKSLWNLAGVVEGPPPFVLNGKDLSHLIEFKDYPSEFEYGRSTQESAESSHENSIDIHVSVGGEKVGGADYRNALEENFCKDTTFEVETVYKVHPVVDSSYGYLAYLKPNVSRWQYRVNSWKGDYTGREEYMFFISGANLQFERYSMDTVPGSPDPHDITSYLDRRPDTKYPRICTPVAMRYETGSSEEVYLAGEKEVSHSTTTTNSFETHVGWKDIFDIGVGESFSFEQTHTFTFGQHITLTLDCPDAESANHVSAFEMNAYWLMPDTTTDSAYWIPGGYMEGQKPWCVTWEVTRIEYLDGTVLTSVEEEKPAVTLNLDVSGISKDFTITYSLPRAGHVSLKVYDTSGRLVKVLREGTENAGEHSLVWDGQDERGRMLARGVYFARLECGREQMMQKIVMLR